MSNNKQSSLDYYITKLTEILGPEIIKQISSDDNERIARLEKQAKAMHKEEILSFNTLLHKHEMEALNNNTILLTKEEFYNKTFGGNDE